MYRLFIYGYAIESKDVYITDEYEFNTFEEALRRTVSFNDDVLFEIAKDEPWYADVTSLKTVARPACMRSLVNSYYVRW